ncbi:hypothetical protein BESB_033960 [Besnoitia besnoiti]|uniref:SRS domain-containing protein n=1 Tax=Besnoitia besnoiti TaxID=94643 RepID=A0A2A9MEJ5_BESBE|nr:hypothetical protein BESB_033960 [Besnoitia besnoiti]PFH36938.1 hypothetical protein BESB_033960 [Besnoitia besnoiti]
MAVCGVPFVAVSALIAVFMPFASAEVQSFPISGVQPVPTSNICDAVEQSEAGGNKMLPLQISPSASSISFTCSANKDAALTPADGMFFDKEDCQSPNQLVTVWSDATLTPAPSQGKKQVYTLTVPKTQRQGKTVYYCCDIAVTGEDGEKEVIQRAEQSVEEKNRCVVKITVDEILSKPEAPSEHQQVPGQQGDVAQEKKCETGTENATVSTDKPLLFKCGPGMALQPAGLENVFDGSDGTCATSVNLKQLVDAELSKANQENTRSPQENESYTFSLKTTPKHDASLCYRCVLLDESSQTGGSRAFVRTVLSEQKQCLLKILIQGTSGPAGAGPPSRMESSWFAATLLLATICSLL